MRSPWQQRRQCYCRRRLWARLALPCCRGKVRLTKLTRLTNPTIRLPSLLPLRAAAAAAAGGWAAAAADAATMAAAPRSLGGERAAAAAEAAHSRNRYDVPSLPKMAGLHPRSRYDVRVAAAGAAAEAHRRRLPVTASAVTASAAAEAHPHRKASAMAAAAAAAAVPETWKEAVAAPSQRPQSPVDEAGRAPPQLPSLARRPPATAREDRAPTGLHGAPLPEYL